MERYEMDPTIHAQIAQINGAIGRTRRLYQRWAQHYGIGYHELVILYTLRADGSAVQKRISEANEIPKQTLNNVIASMKANGLIELVPGDEDRRERRIVLTGSGQEHADRILAPLLKLEEAVIRKLGARLTKQMIETMKTYADILESEMGPEY